MRNPIPHTLDYEALGREDEALRPYVHSGRIDFGDNAAVAALNAALLRVYFSLDVRWPPECLTPTVPSRAAQLLAAARVARLRPHGVVVDVGTGASAIYALLAARMFDQVRVYATEVDGASAASARENISRNGLAETVCVFQTDIDGPLLPTEFTTSLKRVSLLICNPPFFAPGHVARDKATRSQTALPYTQSEGYTPGGEVTFVSRLFDETSRLPAFIGAWCFALLGTKASIDLLRSHAASTCDTAEVRVLTTRSGKTTRWLYAWKHPQTIENLKSTLAHLPGVAVCEDGTFLLTIVSWTRTARRSGPIPCHMHVGVVAQADRNGRVAPVLSLLDCACSPRVPCDRSLFNSLKCAH